MSSNVDLIMRTISKREYIGWGAVGLVILPFLGALLFGSSRSSSFVAFSTMLFSFLPFFIFPFRSAFAGHSFTRGVLIGWVNFVLGQIIFTVLYATLYPKYQNSGWVPPEGNGVPAAMFIGWLPGILISALASAGARDSSVKRKSDDKD